MNDGVVLTMPLERVYETDAAASNHIGTITIRMVPSEALIISEAIASHHRVHEAVHDALRRAGFKELDCGCIWEGIGLARAVRRALEDVGEIALHA